MDHRSQGALARRYASAGLPIGVASAFLTHGHTHERLLDPINRAALSNAIQDKRFSFDRSPSISNGGGGGPDENSSAARSDFYALTHGDLASRHTVRSHAPTDGRLAYLYGSSTARLDPADLHPRQARTYVRGECYEPRLRLAARPPDPHPSLRAHAETSTFRRATTGRRHQTFPERVRGDFARTTQPQQPVYAQTARTVTPQPHANGSAEAAFRTPTVTLAPSHAPDAPQKSRLVAPRPAPSPAPFPPATPFSSLTARTAAATPAPPASAPLPPQLARAAHAYTRTHPPAGSLSAASSLAWSQPAASPAGPLPPGQSGFASHAQAGVSAFSFPSSFSRTGGPLEPTLRETLPTSYAAFAQHKYDHTPSFGTNGVFRAVPTTKRDHGLQQSQRLW